MSVKFEKETVTKTTEGLADAAAEALGQGKSKGKDDIIRDVGEALTKGGGANGYLAVSNARNCTCPRDKWLIGLSRHT